MRRHGFQLLWKRGESFSISHDLGTRHVINCKCHAAYVLGIDNQLCDPLSQVLIWYYFWVFVSGFAETITSLDHALSFEISEFSPEIQQRYFRTVLLSTTCGSITGFGENLIPVLTLGLYSCEKSNSRIERSVRKFILLLMRPWWRTIDHSFHFCLILVTLAHDHRLPYTISLLI